jgi:hypothetical protein
LNLNLNLNLFERGSYWQVVMGGSAESAAAEGSASSTS